MGVYSDCVLQDSGASWCLPLANLSFAPRLTFLFAFGARGSECPENRLRQDFCYIHSFLAALQGSCPPLQGGTPP